MGSEESSHFFFFVFSLFFVFFFFFFFRFSLLLSEDKGKRLQFTAKMGISHRPRLHAPTPCKTSRTTEMTKTTGIRGATTGSPNKGLRNTWIFCPSELAVARGPLQERPLQFQHRMFVSKVGNPCPTLGQLPASRILHEDNDVHRRGSP